MAIFKCKMCGGALEITGSESVIECEYCGTSQTLPKLDDEKRANLYDRANHFRRNNEFDKAMGIYEQILNEDNTDAEAYWSLVLCRYGIEYVEDPATKKRVPTVNRAQFTSIFDDEDYKSALSNADGLQKSIYEAEAKAINEIQKGILEISGKEEPFDVFICYKETDASGRRTPDSVLANDLYHQLTQEGFKVFFSRITLEDKLGSAYEPYIFAALNSSKVMVALGTKPEYFKAVWVKNEWSRYLALIKKGEKKMLIPAYKDMDPYDLPEEFSHLQAQDMAKLGFMQDLIRGIKKIIASDEPKTTVVKETVVAEGASNTAPLLKRMFMFLEDGAWDSANEYAEKVLDIEPECAEAYLGKLMAELQVRKREGLKDIEKPFDDVLNYEKVMRFGDDKLKAELSGYIDFINDRNEKARIEAERQAEKARIEAERQAEEARIEAERIAKRNKKIAIITTPIVCAIIVFIIILNTVIIPNGKYNDAIALMDAGKYIEAYEALAALDGYKDSIDKANSIYGKYKIEKLKSTEEGECIFFGAYEQDNNVSNGKEEIEWMVLDKQNNKILVISKYALDCKQYNEKHIDITWETCSLRRWLNNGFVNNAFSAEETAVISKVTVSADENPEYGTNPGNATQDKIFLLSIAEAKKYFSSNSERQCKPTAYAIEKGVFLCRKSSNCCWWLRSPGSEQNGGADVDYYGDVSESGKTVYGDGTMSERGNSVAHYGHAVRPAMWINIE
ncbi:MAG: TIR domain-containing protein [Clostridia bacterium]|nr:TIR domain-containing protein [Clostridia bacterium]